MGDRPAVVRDGNDLLLRNLGGKLELRWVRVVRAPRKPNRSAHFMVVRRPKDRATTICVSALVPRGRSKVQGFVV